MKFRIMAFFATHLSALNYALLLRIYLHVRHGRWPRGLNFLQPESFNEKITYLKLNRFQPAGCTLADKIKMKDYVAEKIGKQYVIPTLAIYDRPNEIIWSELPNEFVMKASHGSGMNLICNDKHKLDRSKAESLMQHWLAIDYSLVSGEWQYRHQPRIICERYLENTAQHSLLDYKFFCFDGEPRYVQVDIDRNSQHRRNIYNTQWQLQPCMILYPQSEKSIQAPENLARMLEIASILSVHKKFLRVDLYEYQNQIFVGELTYHPGGGCEFIRPYEFDIELGKLLNV